MHTLESLGNQRLLCECTLCNESLDQKAQAALALGLPVYGMYSSQQESESPNHHVASTSLLYT